MFNAIGPVEMLVIFVIVLMVFGADKIPELARGLGKGIREFKRAANMVRNEILSETNDLRMENPLKKEMDEITDSLKPNAILDVDLDVEEKPHSTKKISSDKNNSKQKSKAKEPVKKQTTNNKANKENQGTKEEK